MSDIEIEEVIDRLMALIIGCADFCDDCSIFRNSTKCNLCSGNRINVNGVCVCNKESDITI